MSNNESLYSVINPSTPGTVYVFADGKLGSNPNTSSSTAILSANYFNVENDTTTNSVNFTDSNDATANTWAVTLDSASNYWNTFIGKQFLSPTILDTFALINSSSSTLLISGSSTVTLSDSPVTISPNTAYRMTFLFTSMTQSNGIATSGIAKVFLGRIF